MPGDIVSSGILYFMLKDVCMRVFMLKDVCINCSARTDLSTYFELKR